MTSEIAPTSGEVADRSTPARRRGSIWPWIVGSLLAITVIKYVVVLSTIASDPSIAIQEDYYRRALAWDEAQEARARSHALGWDVRTAVGPATSAPETTAGLPPARVTLTVEDRNGTPVAGAAVALRLFHRARAAAPFDATGVTDDEGHLEIDLATAKHGLWELELEVDRAGDRFTETRTLIFGARPTGGTP